MAIIYTIGFTKKTAEKFFESLHENGIDTLIDIRLNNTSQLAGFSKYPDIEYFLEKLYHIRYIHDVKFAPEAETLELYKKNQINWEEYIVQFNRTMEKRNIFNHIKKEYSFVNKQNICLLCSEEKPQKCHRSLVAVYFQKNDDGLVVKHL